MCMLHDYHSGSYVHGRPTGMQGERTFLTSKRFLSSSLPALAFFAVGAVVGGSTSMSAIVVYVRSWVKDEGGGGRDAVCATEKGDELVYISASVLSFDSSGPRAHALA